MGMTLVEKIFANKLNREIYAGETLFAPVDLILGTDITVALSVKIFEEMGAKKVADPTKTVFINDHFVPAKDIASANLSKKMKEFAAEQGIENYYEVGRSGICHITIPENGYVVPGDIVVGADSHTCTYGALAAFASGIGSTDMAAAWATGKLWFRIPQTIKIRLTGKLNPYVCGKDLILHVISQLGQAGALYKALEFTGPLARELTMADRLTIANMAIECGAKTGLFEADETTRNYLKDKTGRKGDYLKADQDAEYERELEVDATTLQPLVAAPYDPSNVRTVEEVEGVELQQVVIGSCTNGRIEDFRTAHETLKGKKVHPGTRLILIPGSPMVLKQMVEENLLTAFIEAGATITPPTCGPCIGGHMGVLAENEVGLYTTNRNFVGRNGPKTSQVYLSGPAVAAESAVAGKITTPIK
ncbi:MAG: 3-isopropylmalate dehydratase large subunit [bacterium]|nr:3-isopropylmalate dehydratase large subunit [bacterium]